MSDDEDEFPALTEALRAHVQLTDALRSFEHDSDCDLTSMSVTMSPTVCTCVSGDLGKAMAALLHAHRPRELTEGQREMSRERNWLPTYVECAGDGLLCVDSSENANDYPCPTIELIERAIGGLS